MEGNKMDFNFFTWLREGVRQSVLLGVSDAVEQIGMPPENEELNQKVAALLEDPAKPQSKGRGGAGGTKRKRLGKTLKELDTSPATK